ERHAGIVGDLLARELAEGFRIDPILFVRDVHCARNMAAADCADIFTGELLRRADIQDLHIRIVEPRHHLLGGDRYCRIDFQFERDWRKLRDVTTDRPACSGPVLDAFMVDADVAAAEILQGVKTEIGMPRAAAAVDDDFAIRIQAGGAKYLLDAFRRDEILGIFIAQNSCRVADADGARNMSFGIGIGSSYVPNNRIPRDSLGDILAINDGSRRGCGGLRPQERKRNEYETFHNTPSVSPTPVDRTAALPAPSMPAWKG